MRYRRLTNDELQELETEFVQFLVSNTITSEDWVELKTTESTKAEQLIEMFSDIVFEKIVSKAEYLEFKTPTDIKTFHCLPDKIVLNGLLMSGDSPISFLDELPADEMMQNLKANPDVKLQIYTAEKDYRPDRNSEIFRMLEGGAKLSKSGELFKTIEGFKN